MHKYSWTLLVVNAFEADKQCVINYVYYIHQPHSTSNAASCCECSLCSRDIGGLAAIMNIVAMVPMLTGIEPGNNSLLAVTMWILGQLCGLVSITKIVSDKYYQGYQKAYKLDMHADGPLILRYCRSTNVALL